MRIQLQKNELPQISHAAWESGAFRTVEKAGEGDCRCTNGLGPGVTGRHHSLSACPFHDAKRTLEFFDASVCLELTHSRHPGNVKKINEHM